MTARQVLSEAAVQRTDGPRRFARWMVSDARAIGGAVLTPDARFVVGAAAVLVPTAMADPFVNHGIRSASGRHVESWFDATNELTGSRARLPMLGVFGVSLASGHRGFQDAAFTSLQSWLYAGVFHRAVKGLVGRARPNAAPDGTHFEPFSEHRSFPSGHTTDAFAIVTPWILYADTPVAWALFAVPAGTAAARLEKGKHFLSDVLAGAAIGIGTSVFLVRRHRSDRARYASGGDARPRAKTTGVSADLRLHPRGAHLVLSF